MGLGHRDRGAGRCHRKSGPVYIGGYDCELEDSCLCLLVGARGMVPQTAEPCQEHWYNI